jgi:hypoxanthine phosphoribosyltransferase
LDVTGKDVIILEDIVDTGYTLNKLTEKLKFLNPASLEIAALLSKPAMRKINIDIKYIGLEIPPFFVIGYGLDYAEKGRNLPEIYSHEEE